MLSLGILSGIAVMLFWGIADFLLAFPSKKIGGVKTMFIQNSFGIIFSLILLFTLFNSNDISITKKQFIIVAIGGVLDFFAIYFFYKSFEIGEISIVSPISGSYSLVTVILSFFILGEVLLVANYIGVVLVIIGIILTSVDLNKIKQFHTVKGMPESIAAMILWGVYFFIIANLSKEMNAISLFAFTGLFNGTLVVLFSIFSRKLPTRKDYSIKNLVFVLIICTILYNLAWLAMTYGATIEQMSLLAPISSLYPAITIILAVIFLKEKLINTQKIGIVMILVSLFLLSI